MIDNEGPRFIHQPLFCTAESEIVLEGLRCSLRSNKKVKVIRRMSRFFFFDDLTGFEITSCSRYNISPLRSVLDLEKQEIVLMTRSIEMMMTTSKSSLFQREKLLASLNCITPSAYIIGFLTILRR
ncbi:hypothetical protein YC2023_116737 [Brassica napus]